MAIYYRMLASSWRAMWWTFQIETGENSTWHFRQDNLLREALQSVLVADENADEGEVVGEHVLRQPDSHQEWDLGEGWGRCFTNSPRISSKAAVNFPCSSPPTRCGMRGVSLSQLRAIGACPPTLPPCPPQLQTSGLQRHRPSLSLPYVTCVRNILHTFLTYICTSNTWYASINAWFVIWLPKAPMISEVSMQSEGRLKPFLSPGEPHLTLLESPLIGAVLRLPFGSSQETHLSELHS